MIVSMTGFARAETQLPAGALVCELRSVNHRYLEAALRLPEELRALEPELRATLQKELRRGKVDCTFTYRASSAGRARLELDGALVERLAPAAGGAGCRSQRCRRTVQINLVDLLRYPGVLRETAADPRSACWPRRASCSRRALNDLKAMRASEGARLRELVVGRCEQLAAQVAQVRRACPKCMRRSARATPSASRNLPPRWTTTAWSRKWR